MSEQAWAFFNGAGILFASVVFAVLFFGAVSCPFWFPELRDYLHRRQSMRYEVRMAELATWLEAETLKSSGNGTPASTDTRVRELLGSSRQQATSRRSSTP